MEIRYLNFIVPLFAITAALQLVQLGTSSSQFINYAIIAMSVISGGAWYLSESKRIFDRQDQIVVYQEAERHLPIDAKVFVNQPWEFSFHTDRQSAMTPWTSDESTLLQIQEKYQVT